MKNYHFSKATAKRYEVVQLFRLLIALIEVQRRANLYRANVKSGLTFYGICDNVDEILPDGLYPGLRSLFFKGNSYPIQPYHSNSSMSDQKHRWGYNETGNRRMDMLALMIKDLTEYLTNEA